MFYKYAKNIVDDLKAECLILSLSSSNSEDREILNKICNKLDKLGLKIEVELNKKAIIR